MEEAKPVSLGDRGPGVGLGVSGFVCTFRNSQNNQNTEWIS
jgi:hypothetical protein